MTWNNPEPLSRNLSQCSCLSLLRLQRDRSDFALEEKNNTPFWAQEAQVLVLALFPNGVTQHKSLRLYFLICEMER